MWTIPDNSKLCSRRRALNALTGSVLGAGAVSGLGCRSSTLTSKDGVRFEIDRDLRWHRVENSGDTFSYDSPELTVTVARGQITVNAEPCGSVQPGDLVQITSMGTVLVNGERRGDSQTGQEKLRQRLELVKQAVAQEEAKRPLETP